MFAKIFNQIYDSSIVESPETRFTFMDFLILADQNGVVDMTHEAVARRTNRPVELIRKTVSELEGPDPRSRTPDENGARICRLDDHRDWGWCIVNYDYFRKLSSQEQRREKTKLRVRKLRKNRESLPVTLCNAAVTKGNDSPSASSYLSVLKSERVRERFKQWIPIRKAQGKKPKDWDAMFAEQCEFLKQFDEAGQIEAISASIRGNWQGLFAPKQPQQSRNGARPDHPKPIDKSKIEVPERFKAWVAEHYPARREDAMKWRTWADVPSNGLRGEWWKEEKAKLPIGDLL